MPDNANILGQLGLLNSPTSSSVPTDRITQDAIKQYLAQANNLQQNIPMKESGNKLSIYADVLRQLAGQNLQNKALGMQAQQQSQAVNAAAGGAQSFNAIPPQAAAQLGALGGPQPPQAPPMQLGGPQQPPQAPPGGWQTTVNPTQGANPAPPQQAPVAAPQAPMNLGGPAQPPQGSEGVIDVGEGQGPGATVPPSGGQGNGVITPGQIPTGVQQQQQAFHYTPEQLVSIMAQMSPEQRIAFTNLMRGAAGTQNQKFGNGTVSKNPITGQTSFAPGAGTVQTQAGIAGGANAGTASQAATGQQNFSPLLPGVAGQGASAPQQNGGLAPLQNFASEAAKVKAAGDTTSTNINEAAKAAGNLAADLPESDKRLAAIKNAGTIASSQNFQDMLKGVYGKSAQNIAVSLQAAGVNINAPTGVGAAEALDAINKDAGAGGVDKSHLTAGAAAQLAKQGINLGTSNVGNRMIAQYMQDKEEQQNAMARRAAEIVADTGHPDRLLKYNQELSDVAQQHAVKIKVPNSEGQMVPLEDELKKANDAIASKAAHAKQQFAPGVTGKTSSGRSYTVIPPPTQAPQQ